MLLDQYRYAQALAADGRGHTERWVETVKHGVGTQQQGALPALEHGAGRRITVGPGTERDVKACLLEYGEVRDRQRRVVVLDEDSWASPGSAR